MHADGSEESWTYAPDDVPSVWTNRDGVIVTYTRDAANRVRSAVPTGPDSGTAVALDSGDSFDYDPLSRLLAASRPSDDQRVTEIGWDLGGRLLGEVVGGHVEGAGAETHIVDGREPFGWKYDAYDNAIETRLPGGAVHAAGAGDALTGWQRQFDTLDQLQEISGLGDSTRKIRWQWFGAGRLESISTLGGLGTRARYGYHGGTGPTVAVPDGQALPWQLGALEWGTAGGEIWGSFGLGWRNGDVVKLSRPALGASFAGMGWSYGYDAASRLATAQTQPEKWVFGYGMGDERQSETISASRLDFETGPDGRIASRGGIAFGYDNSGRRTADDRFEYQWNWRGAARRRKGEGDLARCRR